MRKKDLSNTGTVETVKDSRGIIMTSAARKNEIPECVTSKSIHLGPFRSIIAHLFNMTDVRCWLYIYIYDTSKKLVGSAGTYAGYESGTDITIDVSGFNGQYFIGFKGYRYFDDDSTWNSSIWLNNIRFTV